MARGVCQMPNCSRPMNGRGMCKLHYMQWYNANKPKGTFVAIAKPKADKLHGVQADDSIDAYWEWVKKELKLA